MTLRTVRVEARAKVNLGLRVLSREASGYHKLATIFARIGLADDVIVRVGGRGRQLDCRGTDTGPTERNLAWRAAIAFHGRAGWPSAFAIEIDKRIPVGGGLGGGSADAAAVLRALNAIAPHPLSLRDLQSLAFALGADVPFLVSPHALAFGRGRGERLRAMPLLMPRGITLHVPTFGVATADAFRWLAEDRAHGRAPGPVTETFEVESAASWQAIADFCTNDLEPVVAQRVPALGRALNAMRASRGAAMCGMTGSGSTLFAVGADTSSPVLPVASGWRRIETMVAVAPGDPEPVA